MKKQDVLPYLTSLLKPENLQFPEISFSDFKVVGLGKAAPAHLSEYFKKHGYKDHLIITKEGVPDLGLNCLFGGHPLYTNDSFVNGEKLVEWIEKDSKDILFLVTGGASAVVEKLKEGIDKNEVLDKIEIMLSSSTSINELNSYRKEVSQLKGGGLKNICGKRNIHTWIVKDVPGDDVSNVGSGPTLTAADANYSILSSYEKLMKHAQQFEYDFITPPKDAPLESELQNLLTPGRTISGGELTVDVKGEGRGGRNSHFVLRAGYELFEKNVLNLAQSDLYKVFIASMATDGDDGNSGIAGGFLDYTSWRVAKSFSLNAEECLNDFNSASFLERLGCHYLTGITGTNVMDLRLIHIP